MEAIDKQYVIEWVKSEIPSLQSSLDESPEERVQRYQAALTAYDQQNDPSLLTIALLDSLNSIRRGIRTTDPNLEDTWE